MGKQKDFIIPFVGLGLGFHEFTYEVNDVFFENFEYSEIKKGNVNVSLSFEKQESMFVLDFQIKGTVNIECDRCLEDYNQDISSSQQLIIQFGETYNEESDEIITIPENAYEIDVAPYIYEYIHLSLPIRRVHSGLKDGSSGCNQKVIKKLNEHSESEQTDPRWDVLKKLKEKL